MGSVELRRSVNDSHPRQLGVFYGIQATNHASFVSREKVETELSGEWLPHLNSLYGLRLFEGEPSHGRVGFIIPAHVQSNGPGVCLQLQHISLQHHHWIQLTRGAYDAVAKVV